MVGQSIRILTTVGEQENLYDEIASTLAAGGVWKGEVKVPCKDGSSRWVNTIISALFDENGVFTNSVAVMEDITEKKNLTEQLWGLTECYGRYLTIISLELLRPKF